MACAGVGLGAIEPLHGEPGIAHGHGVQVAPGGLCGAGGVVTWPEVASSANTRVVDPSPCSGTERKVDISARNPVVDAFARLLASTACRCAAALAPVMEV